MAMCIRRKKVVRHYKDKSYIYTYYELEKTFRDKSKPGKVISKFVKHLGKKNEAIANLKAYRDEKIGPVTLFRLIGEIRKELPDE